MYFWAREHLKAHTYLKINNSGQIENYIFYIYLSYIYIFSKDPLDCQFKCTDLKVASTRMNSDGMAVDRLNEKTVEPRLNDVEVE